MRESHIEHKVTELAKARGWLSFKWVSPSQRGVPDRIYFKQGELVIIEFKAPDKKPTPYQLAIHRRLKNAGFHVHVVDSIKSGSELLC
tara:strand:- start:5573 stop:5836 length:264 start_codon:yes stop_codon:yes gene_type:complete